MGSSKEFKCEECKDTGLEQNVARSIAKECPNCGGTPANAKKANAKKESKPKDVKDVSKDEQTTEGNDKDNGQTDSKDSGGFQEEVKPETESEKTVDKKEEVKPAQSNSNK